MKAGVVEESTLVVALGSTLSTLGLFIELEQYAQFSKLYSFMILAVLIPFKLNSFILFPFYSSFSTLDHVEKLHDEDVDGVYRLGMRN